MRELHDGIELLNEEREAGPFVWCNWDKWVDRCEKVVNHIDGQMSSRSGRHSSTIKLGKHEHVCGVDWKTFKSTVAKYRSWVNERYGGVRGVKDQLIFAHNDVRDVLRPFGDIG